MTEQAPPGRPGRRSYPKGVRCRQKILDSAIALFAQRGVDRASLRTVGEAIGGPPTRDTFQWKVF